MNYLLKTKFFYKLAFFEKDFKQ